MPTAAEDLLCYADDLCLRLDQALGRMESKLMTADRLAMVDLARSVIDADEMNAYCAEVQAKLGIAMALIDLLDADDVTMWSAKGGAVQAPTDESLCQYVVASGDPLRVDDSNTFCSTTPGMDGMRGVGMHSYYGEPLVVRGLAVGSFCALDTEARVWSDEDRALVRDYAATVASRIDYLIG